MFLPLCLVTILISGVIGTSVRSRPQYQTDDNNHHKNHHHNTYEEIQDYLKGLAKSYARQTDERWKNLQYQTEMGGNTRT